MNKGVGEGQHNLESEEIQLFLVQPYPLFQSAVKFSFYFITYKMKHETILMRIEILVRLKSENNAAHIYKK